MCLCRTFALPNDHGENGQASDRRPVSLPPVAREGPSCETEGLPERQEKMFTKNSIFNRNTELCVDLKTILTSDRKAKRFKDYRGVLTRDGREHFTFMEEAPERKARKHNPCVYKGYTINVHRRDDGIIYPTFRQPQYTRYYTFKDFCREAAEELLLVVSLLENE